MSYATVDASDFDIAPSSVSTIVRDKDRYRKLFYEGHTDVSKKRARPAKHEDVEEALLRWVSGWSGHLIFYISIFMFLFFNFQFLVNFLIFNFLLAFLFKNSVFIKFKFKFLNFNF